MLGLRIPIGATPNRIEENMSDELKEVKNLARALIEKMKAVYENPQYNGAWILYHEHFGDYKKNGGLQWTDEQDALDAWLKKHE